MKKILVPILFLGINIINSQQAKIQTDDFEIVSASPGLDYVLNHAIRSAHNALSFHKKLFNYKPNEKIFVLFTDFGDYGNGGATSLPHNLVTTNMAPMNYSFESSVAGERVFSIMNHEFVHIAALDKAKQAYILLPDKHHLDQIFDKMLYVKLLQENLKYRLFFQSLQN